MKGPGSVERHGGYEDVYVKTKEGWRIKSRTHVRNKAWHNPHSGSALTVVTEGPPEGGPHQAGLQTRLYFTSSHTMRAFESRRERPHEPIDRRVRNL